jgi:MraZ protein
MALFTDQFAHLLDDKGRLAIPAAIRDAMVESEDGVGFYAKPTQRCLELIPEKTFARMAQKAHSGLVVSNDVAKLKRLLFANTARLIPDKQGRVVIPDRFRTESAPGGATVRLSGEVMFVGVGDWVELWNRAEFESHLKEISYEAGSLDTAAEKLFGGVEAKPA